MWTPPADQVVTDTGWRPPSDAVISDNQPSNAGLQNVADAIQGATDKVMTPLSQVSDTVARGASNLMFGSEKPAQYAEQGLGMLGQGIQKLGEGVAGGTGYIAQRLANATGSGNQSMAPTDYAAATAGMAASAIPQLLLSKYMEGRPAPATPNELPLDVAQAREARTGVPAKNFQALYKDPGAIFAGSNIPQAGADIGAAKAVAGINPGVTNDIASLTPENIDSINPTKETKIEDINNAISKIKQQNLQVQPGTTTGSPYALFDYNDPITGKPSYKIYGDPSATGIKTTGNVPIETVTDKGIPVTGMTQKAADLGHTPPSLTPQEANDALKSVNSILSQPSIQNNRDVFRQWSAIKTHLNNALGDVAPDVKAANANYAREKLGESFQGMDAVNKNGKPSKLGLMAQGAASGLGAIAGHLVPGLNTPEGMFAGYQAGKYLNQAYHAPYIAGLQTAAGSVADKALGPILNGVQQSARGPLIQAYIARYLQGKQNQ